MGTNVRLTKILKCKEEYLEIDKAINEGSLKP